MRKILVSDVTLRDGNHAVKHKINEASIRRYAQSIDKTGVDIIEVGHGNGIGASSLHIGLSTTSDNQTLAIAREVVKNAKLSVHVIPGLATIRGDLANAIDMGVDIVRIASHCTEANITQPYVEYARKRGVNVYGVLMMSHMADKNMLLDQAQQMTQYGAQAIVLMDSAGAYLPVDVREKVGALVDNLDVPVGFHAHNNLGMSIANSLEAVEAGAQIVDGTSKGFGAGAGNAAIEVLVAALQKMGFADHVNLFDLMYVCDQSETYLVETVPSINSISIASGLYGVFSGFSKPVKLNSEKAGVDPKAVFRELGLMKVVAGQEDLIIEAIKRVEQASA